MKNKILIKNVTIFKENEIIENGYIEIDNGIIVGIGLSNELLIKEDGILKVIDLSSSKKAIPGMIDLHIHGANGSDVMDATEHSLKVITEALPKEGTTSFLATTMTQGEKEIEKALDNINSFINQRQPAGAEIIGVHLEGPFISPKKVGAQNPRFVQEPKINLFNQWNKVSGNNIKVVTLAPELIGSKEFIQHLVKEGIVVSSGHTNATFEEMNLAIDDGLKHATHLFNQMTGLHHRKPGVVGAVLSNNDVLAEIIADGMHIHPEMIRLVFKIKGSKGIVLITDAMRAKCLGEGIYDLGGQKVFVSENKATLEDGTLAGSVIKMNEAIKNMMEITGCELQDIIQMTSENPAK